MGNIVDTYRRLPHEVRDAIGGYWRNQVILNMDTPLEDLCLAWVAMIDGDVDEATVALQRAIASSDGAVVAQWRETLALLQEGEDDRAAQNLYAEAATHSTATFATYQRATKLRHENRPSEAEPLLARALENVAEGDAPGVQFIASEYVAAL